MLVLAISELKKKTMFTANQINEFSIDNGLFLTDVFISASGPYCVRLINKAKCYFVVLELLLSHSNFAR